jgi:Mg-chelatase subunit ChlD
MSDNKLVKVIVPKTHKSLLQQKLEQAKNNPVNSIDPTKAEHRIGIVFDDSGSMCGEPIRKAKEAVAGFLKTCNPSNTAITVYPLNASPKPLTNNWGLVNLFTASLKDSGGTPLYGTVMQCINNEPVTRMVVFSDGEPDYYERDTADISNEPVKRKEGQCIDLCTEKKIKVDTVYIGHGENLFLKRLAERTGGIYIHFTDMSVFAKNMKYLAPTFYAMLADPSVKDQVEKGTYNG